MSEKCEEHVITLFGYRITVYVTKKETVVYVRTPEDVTWCVTIQKLGAKVL